MGFLNDLFGDEGKRADMLKGERRRFEGMMLDQYLPLFEERMMGIIDQVSADQALDIESLQASFQEQRQRQQPCDLLLRVLCPVLA